MRLSRPLAVAALATGIALAATNTSSAGLTTVNIVGSGSQNVSPKTQGKFDGTVSYDSATAKLTITLNNLNTAAEGGYITAFAFNNPGDKITKATLFSTTNANFDLSGTGLPIPKGKDKGKTAGNDSVSANPYGNFDFLLSTGDDFEGGGDPKGGIGTAVANKSATFVIDLTGTGLGSLTATSFATTPDDGTGSKTANLLARFRGFEDKGSDKVPGTVQAVPEPSLMAMGAAGVAGLGYIRRRFGKKATG